MEYGKLKREQLKKTGFCSVNKEQLVWAHRGLLSQLSRQQRPKISSLAQQKPKRNFNASAYGLFQVHFSFWSGDGGDYTHIDDIKTESQNLKTHCQSTQQINNSICPHFLRVPSSNLLRSCTSGSCPVVGQSTGSIRMFSGHGRFSPL